MAVQIVAKLRDEFSVNYTDKPVGSLTGAFL